MSRIKPVAAATLPGMTALLLAGNLLAQSTPAFATTVETASLNVDRGVTTLTVEAPRPVATAIQALVSREGVLITYEDPPYTYGGDRQDVTHQFAKGWAKYVPNTIVVPRGGKLAISVPSTDVSVILGKLVQVQSEADTGGRFRVEKSGDTFHVIPTATKDRKGQWISITPVLDVPISLPAEERTDAEMIRDICMALSTAAHVEISDGMNLGTGIFIPGAVRHYRLEAHEEAARSVLMRALAAMAGERGKIGWLLFEDPKDGTYVLNPLIIPDRQPQASPPTSQLRNADAPQQAHGIGTR